MRFLVFVFCHIFILAKPATAEDIFAYFERGTWQGPARSQATCEINPIKIQFAQKNTRAHFSFPNSIADYNGKHARIFSYDIASYDQDGIVMTLDNEQRKTPFGKPVIWVLKRLPNDMYCWGRTDWPSTGCIAIHVRCPPAPPTS